ncbi:MAG: hypothetical protein DIJKHBIC_04379 [Thermoanaerobaculia bacterium]|nr:hypothetical protein [Thermoanaerobaculia bacterium]
MRQSGTVLGVVALAAALTGAPAFAQMGGGPGFGPGDGMTYGNEDLVIPAAVRGAGKLSSFFVTDLWIKASGSGTATVYYHAADSASSAPTATTTVNLSQPITYLPDVLQKNFGLNAGFGALRVSATFPIAATIRVYNQTGAGAYGLAFMGMPARMGMNSMPMGGGYGMDQYAMYMLGLLPEPGNRVNVNVVATSSSGATGVLEIVDADGSTPSGTGAKSLPFTLAGYSSHQFNDVLADVHSKFAAGDAGLQVRVRMNQGTSGMVMAYAVVNDNATNDGYVVMGSMMNGGRGMGGGMGMGAAQ